MAYRSRTTPSGKVRVKQIHTQGTIRQRCSKKPVSGLNEDIKTVEDVIFEINTRKTKHKNIKKRRIADAMEYLEKVQEFQLWRGETAFGKPKTMSGREARDLNKGFESKFFESKDPQARLWRWMVVGTKPVTRGTTLNEYRAQRQARWEVELQAEKSTTT